MDAMFYWICFSFGMSGLTLSQLMIIKDRLKLAEKGNVCFNVADYYKHDFVTPLISLVVVGMCLMLLPYVNHDWIESVWWYKILLIVGYGTLGYTGSDIPDKIFSTSKRLINAALDRKTTIGDLANGVDPTKPTPLKP